MAKKGKSLINFDSSTWVDMKDLELAVEQAVQPRLDQIAYMVEREAKASMKEGGRRGGELIPSTPPNPPHAQSRNLRGSIQYAKTEKGSRVIGPTRAGWYGRAHEFGALIRVTQKMRNFLAWKFGWYLKKSTKVIHLPKRPFMRPALYRVIDLMPELFANLGLANTPIGRRIQASRKRKGLT